MISRQEVVNAYRMILGRDPESEATIQSTMRVQDLATLRSALFSSGEFGQFAQQLARWPFRESCWVLCPIARGKLRMFVDLRDQYVSRGCLMDNYEPEETKAIRKILSPGDSFLDVGANIGWHSLMAANIVGSSGKVYSFEPHPVIGKMFHFSIYESRMDDVITWFPFGCSDQEGMFHLYSNRDGINPGGSFIGDGAPKEDHDVHRIRLATIDSELSAVTSLRMVKIDVEGAEYRALAGATKLLMRTRPIILSEVFPRQLSAVSNVTVKKYFDFLIGLKYSPFKLSDFVNGNKLTPITAEEIEPAQNPINLLFVPE